MLDLRQANLRLPMLLINADYTQVRDFCQQQLCSGDPRSQTLWAAGTHPDFLELAPELEQIRGLNDFVHSKPQLAKFKIILIPGAEQLNAYAANALLKNLEEPGESTLFILLAPHPKLLLPTIVSRCQVLFMQNDNGITQDSETSDNIAEILTSVHTLCANRNTSILKIAEQWHSKWADKTLYWLELAFATLIKDCYLGLAQPPMPMAKMWKLFDKIKTANIWCAQKLQPNKQLLLESILCEI